MAKHKPKPQKPPYICTGCAGKPTMRDGKYVTCKCGAAPNPSWKLP